MNSRLWELLKRQGVKQKDLEELTGISHGAISALCNGKSEPTLRSARAISKALGLSIDEIWPEENPDGR